MKPMLATSESVHTVSPTLEAVRYPVYASRKLDGVRGLVPGGALKSRKLLTFPNLYATKLLTRHDLSGVDGELAVGPPNEKETCSRTAGALARIHWQLPELKFYLFDNFEARGGFAIRNATLAPIDAALPSDLRSRMVIVEQRLIRNAAELLGFEATALAEGYEGLILRDPNGPYKHGRSTMNEGWMLKLKRFTDAEAIVIAVEEEMENTNPGRTNAVGRTQRSSAKAGKVGKGRAGAFLVRDIITDVEFSVGGFSDKDKDYFWKIRSRVPGKIIKYKSFPSLKDKPRNPIYLSGRETWDMS